VNYKVNVRNSGRACRLLLLLGLLNTFGRQLPDIRSDQEVQHRLIALLHGEQLRDLHVSASAHSPSRYFLHLFPRRPLMVFPLAAVADEILPGLGYSPATAAAPPALVVISLSKLFLVCSHWRVSGFQFVGPGCQLCRNIHWDGFLSPSFAS